MIMKVKEITQQEDWRSDTSEFLQSWEWGEFQRVIGNIPIRLYARGKYLQGFEHVLPFGMSFVYFSRYDIGDIMPNIISFLKTQGYLFARVEPIYLDVDLRYPIIKCRQPQHTLLLDLTKSGEQLLADMHSKTRYNIRLAEKKGVKIIDKKNVDWFWNLNKQTSLRDNFKSHSRRYYETMLDMPIVRQFTAFFDERPIASHIYISYNGTFVYLHGASSNEHRNVMATYLLQWESIKIAKKSGNCLYDFWGVAKPKSDGKTFHTYSWDEFDKLSDVTRYKAGFGGSLKSYGGAYEIPFRPVLYRVFKFVRKIL